MASKASPQGAVSTSRSSKSSNYAKSVNADPSRKTIPSSSSSSSSSAVAASTTSSNTNTNTNTNSSSSSSSMLKKKAVIKSVGSENSLSPKVITPDKRPSVRAFISNIEKKAPVLSRHGHMTHEDLLKTKEKLLLSEKSNLDLKKEVSEYKKQMEALTSELQDAIEGSRRDRFHVEEMEKATQAVAGLCQGELEAMKKQYVLDLQKYKDEIEELKKELHICVDARNEAMRLASDAMVAAESTVEKRVEEDLIADHSCTNNVSNLESDSLVNSDTVEELESPLVEELELDGDESNSISAHASEDEESMYESEHNTFKDDESDNISECITSVKETLLVAVENTVGEEENKNLMDIYAFKGVESKNTSKVTCDKDQESDKKLNKATIISESEVMDLRKTIQSLLTDLQISKEAEQRCKLKMEEQGLEVDYLNKELVNANESKVELVLQVSDMESTIKQLRTELREVKETERNGPKKDILYAESLSFSSSPIDVSKVEEAAEEILVKSSVEESVLLAFLQSLVAELGRKQKHIGALLEKEAQEGEKLQALNLKMTRITEENSQELALFSKKLASVDAEKESLKRELENKISELASTVEKETKAVQCAADLQKEIECAQIQVAEIRRNESILAERYMALSMEMDCKDKELSKLRDSERSMASVVSTFEEELEVKKMEELELRKAVSSSNKRCFALSSELDRALSEVLKLRHRESDSCVKIAALCIVLNNISERDDRRFLELQKTSHAQISGLNGELTKLKIELEKALDFAQARSISEIDALTEKLSVSKANEEEIKKELEDAMQENETAWEEIESLRNKVTELETKCDIVDYQAIQQELDMLRIETTQMRKEKEMAEIACKTAEDRLESHLETIKEHRESIVKMMDCIVANENELNEFKIRLKNAEAELEASKINTQKTERELDNHRLEKEAKEKEITELKQHLANTEKAKLNLEGEIQRLLDKSKKFQVNEPDSIDIPVHSEGSRGYSNPEHREEKPQADNAQINKVLKQSSSLCEALRRVDGGLGDDSEVGLREQLSCFSLRRDDVSFRDEVVSLSSENEEKTKKKKKKKGLLTRLGSLLDKKKASH